MELSKVIHDNLGFLNDAPDVYFSPGRVNLIGEHIDYLGGSVFPAAISLGTYGFVTKRKDKELHFLSVNLKDKGVIKVSLENLEYKVEDDWTNYCKGMFRAFLKNGVEFSHGYNILIYGTLPNGAGLSSSASLEVLIGEIINDQLNLQTDMIDIVQTAQKVENNYIGMNCGIMDQFAVGMGQKDKAIHLDTDTLDYSLVPLETGEYTLVIANTNKRRELTDSAYNQRREQCEKGLKTLNDNDVKINALCELGVGQYHRYKRFIKDPVIKNRVEHAVYENRRVNEAVKCLQEGNINRFGELMNQSHDSCRDLYEVSCKELNVLVDAYREYGAIGARMTGAGFGGCVIALVPTNQLDEINQRVRDKYFKEVGYHTDIYPVQTSDGTGKISVKGVKQ